MDSKLIISSILTDLTLSSKIKFIEAKDNEDLIKLAKSKGIDLPSPDLACFRSIYCELDKPNLNNAMLTKKAAEEGINTLIGKQINLNHQGKNYVMGYTIDAKIKDNLVEVTGILFKSLFPEEFDEVKQLFEEGQLFLSFELWNKEPETGNSIIEVMDSGVKKITKMIAHGVGLLLRGVKPACKKAQVFKLLANQKDNGEQIFVEDERFAYASFSNEVVECEHCTTCTCEKEEKIVDDLKVEKIEVQLPEETKIEAETKPAEAGAETEAKIEETAEVKIEAEVKPEEIVVVEEKKEDAQAVEAPIDKKVVSVINEETVTVIDTMDGKIERKGMRKTTRKFDDGTEEVFSEEYQAVQTYTEAQLEEKVNAAKTEKDAEIATLKVEHEKVLAEKDIEITTKKEELGKKDQEIADLKNPTVEPKKEKELTVGNVEVKNRYEDIRKGIDDKAFGKKR